MIPYTFVFQKEKKRVLVPSNWNDVTLGQFIDFQKAHAMDDRYMEIDAFIDLPILEFFLLEDEMWDVLDHQTSFRHHPMLVPVSNLRWDIGNKSINQYETAKFLLNGAQHCLWDVAHLLLAIFSFERDTYKESEAMEWAEFLKQDPISTHFNEITHIFSEIVRIEERYKSLRRKEMSAEEALAGFEKLEKHGFLATLDVLSGGDMIKEEIILRKPVYEVYDKLLLWKEKDECQQAFYEQKKITR